MLVVTALKIILESPVSTSSIHNTRDRNTG